VGDPHTFTVLYILCKCRHVWVYHIVHWSLPWQTHTIFMVDFHTTYINMCGRSQYIHSSLNTVQLQTRMGIPHCTSQFTMADTYDFHGRHSYHIHKYVWQILIHSHERTHRSSGTLTSFTQNEKDQSRHSDNEKFNCRLRRHTTRYPHSLPHHHTLP